MAKKAYIKPVKPKPGSKPKGKITAIGTSGSYGSSVGKLKDTGYKAHVEQVVKKIVKTVKPSNKFKPAAGIKQKVGGKKKKGK